jgi:hypothetical protein
VAIAPEAYITHGLCKQVIHYRLEVYRDIVPLTDLWGMIEAWDTTVVLTSLLGEPFQNHSVRNKTYADRIQEHCNNYISTCGKKNMKYLFKLLSIPLVLFGFSTIQGYTLPKSEREVNKTLALAAKACAKKYKLHVAGEGAAMPGGIVESLFLSFSYQGILTKNEIRKIIVGCTNEVLNAATSNDNLQEHLKLKPFTIDNIDIDVFIHDSQGNYIYDPNIFVADIRNGIITYKTRDPQNDYKYKSEVTETYAEALKLLQQ